MTQIRIDFSFSGIVCLVHGTTPFIHSTNIYAPYIADILLYPQNHLDINSIKQQRKCCGSIVELKKKPGELLDRVSLS